MTNRITKEIQHGRFLETRSRGDLELGEPAGKLRWKRRVQMLSDHLRPGMTILRLAVARAILLVN